VQDPDVEVDPVLHRAVLDAVDRQIAGQQPPLEARRTFYRLVAAGIKPDKIRRQIALLFSLEMIRALEARRPFDENHYTAALRRLPRLPPA
jgi:hypothetical protein